MAWVASGQCFSSPSFYSYNVSTAERRQARPCVRWLLQDRPPLIGQSWSRDPIPSSHWPGWRMRTSWPPLVHSVVSCIGITRSFTRQESRYHWVPGQPGDSGLYLPTCDIMPCWHRGLVTPDIRGHFLLSLGSHHSSINPTLNVLMPTWQTVLIYSDNLKLLHSWHNILCGRCVNDADDCKIIVVVK